MNPLRSLLLSFGPMGLIALSYWVAAPEGNALGTAVDGPEPRFQLPAIPPDRSLSDACRDAAETFREQIPEDWVVIPASPFVIIADLPEDDVHRLLRSTLRPTSRALSVGYFDASPRQPISIFLMSGGEAYRAAVSRFGQAGRSEYAGLYLRKSHLIVLNLETGEGTLAHELTHALAHADCENLPEWFDEGLASLHEECEFSSDGLRLIGLPNWREGILHEALRKNRLPELESFVAGEFAGSGHAARDYAYARYLCLFLQDRNLLMPYYRKLRSRLDVDPTGGWTLANLLGHRELREVDIEFREWLKRHVTERVSAGHDFEAVHIY